MSVSPLRRFYTDAAAARVEGGYAVFLDARRLKTPMRAAVLLPNAALAAAISDEWRVQEEFIEPARMPFTQLAFAAIDGTSKAPDDAIDFIASYAATDLCCYRAESPAELAARQGALWDPLLVWAESELGVRLPVVEGVIAQPVEDSAIARVRAHAATLDHFALTGLAQAASLSGSATIGFAMMAGRIDAEAAYRAATLDEAWNIEHWGEDAEARARLDRVRAQLLQLAQFFTLLKASETTGAAKP
jgi:chaperone required for assembly of F1-ATPase